MTETLEQEPATTPVPPPPPHKHRPPRVYQAAAWVAIVAGVVFIVTAIFFSGFALGRHSGGGFGGHHRGHDEMGSRSAPLMPGMQPGGPMGPMGQSRPDMGPGMRPDAPGSMGPNMRPENPPPPAPASPTPRP